MSGTIGNPPPGQGQGLGMGIDLNAGATETSARGKVTTGGQQANVKEGERAKGTEGVNVHTDTTVAFKESPAINQTKQGHSAAGDPGEPDLPSPKSINQPSVELKGWLNSFYMTALMVNMTQVAMTNKEIHKAEGKNIVQMLERIWVQANDIAALLIAKGEKEAAMHMALAIGAFASLAVAAIGTGLSFKGLSQSGAAKNKSAELETPQTKDATIASPAPIASQPKAQTPHKTDTATPEPATPPSPKPLPTPPQRPPVANNVNPGAPPPRPQHPPAPHTITHDRTPHVNATTERTPGATQPTEKSPQQITKEKIALNDEKMEGGKYHALGMGLTQMAPSVNSIIENLIQMVFKPQIAALEAEIELARGVKDLASKALDSAMGAFSTAGEELNNVLAALAKAIEESIKANSIQRS